MASGAAEVVVDSSAMTTEAHQGVTEEASRTEGAAVVEEATTEEVRHLKPCSLSSWLPGQGWAL